LPNASVTRSSWRHKVIGGDGIDNDSAPSSVANNALFDDHSSVAKQVNAHAADSGSLATDVLNAPGAGISDAAILSTGNPGMNGGGAGSVLSHSPHSGADNPGTTGGTSDTPAPSPLIVTSAPALTVAEGATVEIDHASAQSVTFTGTTGTLKLDDSLHFTGKVSGMAGSDALDLADVNYGASTTATFLGNATSGTLTVSDGTHTASIALQGDYLQSGWTLSSDGHGGTMVVDPVTWPDSTNTGVTAGVTLTPYNGNLVINTPGAVISGLDIHGTVTINANNVTLINCKVTSAAFTVVQIGLGVSGATIENCEVNGVGTGNDGCNGIWNRGTNATILNNNIYNMENGIVPGSGDLIQGNYIHNFNASGAPHYDGIQMDGGISNITITGNTIVDTQGQTSAIMIDNYFGAISNINVNNNLLSGGDFTIYDDAHFNSNPITGVSITNNHLGSGVYGYTDFNGTSPTYTGNVNDGAALIATLDHQTASGPSAPTIVSFTTDSGTVGDHITNDNTLTLSGSAVANSTVNVYDGATLLNSVTANASGAWSYTTAALADGAHSFTATDTVSGTTSAASSALSVTIDTTAPTVSSVTASGTGISSGTGNLNAGDVVTLTVNLSEAVTVTGTPTLTLNDGGTATYTSGSGSNALTFKYTVAAGQNPSDLAVTAANLNSATVTDAAGNAANLAGAVTNPTGTLQIDTTAPSAPSITQFSPDTGTVGDGVTTANVLTLTGTAEANATVKIYDGATLLNSVTANGSGGWTYTTAALANGTHNLTATATDAAGNTGAASSALAVTVMAAPTAPSITSFSPDTGVVGDGITDPAILTLTGTAVANSTVNVYDGATALGIATVSAGGAWTFTTAPLPDGTHSFTATDTISGITSAASTAMKVTVDTIAPVAPTIASFTTDSGVAGDHITDDNTLTLGGSAEANSTVKIYDGATLLNSVTANASGAWTYTTPTLTDGAHNLTATATDAAANTGAASAALNVTIDTVAPNAPVISGDSVVNTEVALTGTAEAHSTVNIYDGTTLLGAIAADGSGAWNYTTNSLSDGAHAFTATATDAAGNTGLASQPVDPVIGAVTVDTTLPTDTITRDVKNWNGSFTLSGTVVDNGVMGTGDTVKIYDGSTYLGSTKVDSQGQWSFTTATLSNKTHVFTSTATDQAGNIGTSAGAAIYGTTGNNALISTGGNDIMTGAGGSDTFVFSGMNFGNDVITDFRAQGRSHDTIQFSKSAFSSFAAVLADAAQVGTDVVISHDAGNSVTLKDVSLSQLTKSDFHFV